MKSGFIALVGRPNVGKSSLINALLGRKVSIVSDKPQTTRNRIVAVLHGDGWQMVLLDTPGIHKPKHLLGKTLVRSAAQAARDVDFIWHVVDASRPPAGEEKEVVRNFPLKAKVLLVGNKSDLPAKDRFAGAYGELYPYAGSVLVSALTGAGLEELKEIALDFLPEGPAYYPEDMDTDQPENFLLAEIIREKILGLTREEIPHSVAVVVDEMKDRETRIPGESVLYARAIIYVERDSQKGIVIGRGGQRLKEIGVLARSELEGILGTRVFLDLRVKVKGDWRNREGFLRNLGLGEG